MKKNVLLSVMVASLLPPFVQIAAAQTITEFTVPTASANPSHIITASDNKLWFTLPGINSIGRVATSATDGSAIEIIDASVTASALPTGITYDSVSNLIWYTLRDTTKIATLPLDATAASLADEKDITSISGCSGVTDPNEIVSGENGYIYFTLTASNKIGRLSIDKTSCQLYTPDSDDGQPTGITLGPDGNIWFTLFAANKIGRLKLSDGTIQELPADDNTSAGPTDIIVGGDGNLWFTMLNANKIGKIDRSTLEIEEYTVTGTGSQVRSISPGPDGTPLWFTLTNDNKIGQIAPSGTVTTLTAVTTAASQPFDITLGSDDNLWFTEFAVAANKIAKLEPDDVLAITNDATLADGAVSESYSVSLIGEDGTAPYTFGLRSGDSLPEGLSLSDSGVISGTPTVSHDSPTNFVVTITDAESVTNSKAFSITIDPAQLPDLSVVLKKVRNSKKKGLLKATASPRNIGILDASNATVHFYLSKNQAYDSSDKQIYDDTYPSIAAGEVADPVTAKYRRSISKRFKYVVACMDVANTVSEQSELNNCDFRKIPSRR